MDPQDDASRPADASRAEAEAPTRKADVAPAEADAGTGSPHVTRVVVWDTPTAVERGRHFTVRVGVACSGRCRPDGWRVEVRDHAGERQQTAALGDDLWPGTDALYHTEVALAAPDAEGLYTWEAAVLTGDALPPGDGALPGDATRPGDAVASDAARPGDAVAGDAVAGNAGIEVPAAGHTDGTARFGVRVVSAPACVVRVVALDAESHAPVEGARVVAHPYRAFTDQRGVAELRVAAGQYRLFVSGRGCVPFRFDGEVQADTTIRAELAQARELSDADIWS